MKLWLDDQIDDKDTPDRHVPNGWIGVKSPKEAIKLLKSGKVTELSFDHDLGNVIGNGYTVACYIERESYFNRIPRIKWSVHSANPVGRDNIVAAMRSADGNWEWFGK